MASKRIKKKRAKNAQMREIQNLIEKAAPYIIKEDLKKIAKQSTTVAARMSTISTLNALGGYISERQDRVNQWRSAKAKWMYGGAVKYHNALENMDKYYLIKHYWDLVKQGHIKHDSTLTYYDDVADWSLDNMSDEELQAAIAAGEEKKAKLSVKEASKMVEF